MDEHELLSVLMNDTKCADCPVAHASGGATKCEFETHVIRKGDSLYAEAEPADGVWFIKAGLVTLGRKTSEAATVAGNASLIGVDCLVSSLRLSDARAETEVKACTMSKGALLRWLGGDKRKLRLVLDAATSDPFVANALDAMD